MAAKQAQASRDSYAVVSTGGNQYTVSPGDRLMVELLEGDQGSSITLDKVLAVKAAGSDELVIGTPTVEGAKVSAKVLGQKRGNKITVFKKKRRQGYRTKNGHRQSLTEIQIESIA